MRLVVLIVALLISIAGLKAQTSTPSANEVLKPVYTKAAKEGKKVLLIFHASWCGWCRKMDASLADAAVRPLVSKYYEIAHLTVYESKDKKALENPGALELVTKFGGAEQGLPYWCVLDKAGNLLANSLYQPGKNTGCPASAEEVDYFISVLRKTSGLSDSELKVVGERMRKNEQ